MTDQELLSYAPFYKLDSRRISYAEYWRITSGLAPFLVAASKKLTGQPIDFGSYICHLDKVIRLQAEGAPQLVRIAVEKAVQRRGYRVVLHYTMPTVSRAGPPGHGCVLMDGKNPWMLHLLYVRRGARERLRTVLTSRLLGGRVLSSVAHEPQFKGPPEDLCFYYPGVDLQQLEELHRKESLEHNPQPLSEQDVERLLVEAHNRSVDDKIRRGIYVKCDTEEVRSVLAGR